MADVPLQDLIGAAFARAACVIFSRSCRTETDLERRMGIGNFQLQEHYFVCHLSGSSVNNAAVRNHSHIHVRSWPSFGRLRLHY